MYYNVQKRFKKFWRDIHIENPRNRLKLRQHFIWRHFDLFWTLFNTHECNTDIIIILLYQPTTQLIKMQDFKNVNIYLHDDSNWR
jgi:hypothetical protein